MPFRPSEPSPEMRRIRSVQHCDAGINKEARLQAARAAEGCQDHFLDPTVNGQRWSEAPFQCELCPIQFRFLIGMRRGRVTIVGYMGYHWVSGRRGRVQCHDFATRCDCGAYQVITSRALSRPDNGTHCCARCNYQASMAWRAANKAG